MIRNYHIILYIVINEMTITLCFMQQILKTRKHDKFSSIPFYHSKEDVNPIHVQYWKGRYTLLRGVIPRRQDIDFPFLRLRPSVGSPSSPW